MLIVQVNVGDVGSSVYLPKHMVILHHSWSCKTFCITGGILLIVIAAVLLVPGITCVGQCDELSISGQNSRYIGGYGEYQFS